MSWTDFHTQCRLLAVGKVNKANAAASTNTLPDKIWHELINLPAAEQKKSAFIYGLLNFHASLESTLSKTVSSYITLLFVVFSLISAMHYTVIWPSFDSFITPFNRVESLDLTTVKTVWPLVNLLCAFAVLSCWVYRFTAIRFCTSQQSIFTDIFLPARAKTAKQQLTSLLRYPLQMHVLPTTDSERFMHQLNAEPYLLAAEIQQQWHQQQYHFHNALSSRLTALQTFTATLVVAAVGLLLAISYQFLFNIGDMI